MKSPGLLVLSPLKKEFDFLTEFFRRKLTASGSKEIRQNVGSLSFVEFPEVRMAFAIGGHGKTQFGIQTQFFLSKLKNVEGVICAGAAGGIKPGMRPGDVVAALRTIEHDYRFRFVPKPVPQFESCPDLLERLRALNFNDPAFDLHFAAVASGDEDVVEPTRAREIHESTGAWAVAWEGAGSARACRFNQVPHLELRGLTDSADASALADFEKNLLRAMENVGQVLLSLSLVER